MTLSFTVPIRTRMGLNNREHHFARHKRVKRERKAVWALFPRRQLPEALPVPVEVLLVRVAPSAGMDDDGLQGALKAVRDQVAAELGVDDGREDLVRFSYAQERGKSWGVRVEIKTEEEP